MDIPVRAAELHREGLASHREGNLAAAFELIEEAVRIHPDFAEACKTLARLSLEANEIRAFQNWCHEASRIAPRDPEPYVMLGDLLWRQGRHGEAAEAYRRALRLDPLDPEAVDRVRERAGLEARPTFG